jgi:hypothetical protein
MSNLTITAKDVDWRHQYTGKLPADINNLTVEVAQIVFRSDIMARGNIRATGNIWADRDIEAKGNIWAGFIGTHGNIRARGNIRVGGDIMAMKSIRALGNIWVGGNIKSPNIVAKGCYIRGRRCKIVDGKLVRPTSVGQDLPESVDSVYQLKVGDHVTGKHYVIGRVRGAVHQLRPGCVDLKLSSQAIKRLLTGPFNIYLYSFGGIIIPQLNVYQILIDGVWASVKSLPRHQYVVINDQDLPESLAERLLDGV